MVIARLGWRLGLVLACALVGCDDISAGGGTDTDTDTGGASTGDSANTNVTNPTNPSGGPTSGDTATGGGMTTEATSTTDAPTTTTTTTDDTNGGLPDGNGCCEAHAGPGCNEPAPELCVCDAAPNCCVFDWTAECVELAVDACAATCEGGDSDTDVGTDTDPTDTDSESGTSRCEDTVIELGAMDAELSGAWEFGMSQVGEGQIIVLGGGQPNGQISFDIPIPCEDQWFIWVRYFEQQDADSFYATLDGEPNPPGVFEGDCTPGGGGWDWALLNYRTEDDPLCQYVEDPWAPQWDEGTHNISFRFRESQALARIEITNNPDYVPSS